MQPPAPDGPRAPAADPARVRLRLLGALEWESGGVLLPLGTPKQRAVLVALLADVGRPVPVPKLIDRVWGEDAPAEVRNALFGHLSRLRGLAARCQDGPVAVVRSSEGYRLEVDPDHLDLVRFRRELALARAPESTAPQRMQQLDAALGRWRGTPLPGVPGDWAELLRQGLTRQWLGALADWGGLALELGDPAAAVDRLSPALAEHPHSEPVAAALIRALARHGRGAEARRVYQAVQQRLVRDLGATPGPVLSGLHDEVLGARPALPTGPQPPSTLPPDVAAFTGRGPQLAALDELARDAERQPAPMLCVVSGTAGVGKTALVLHWAHAVRHRFPDGQLHVDLRGYDSAQPLNAGDALGSLLWMLGVRGPELPPDEAARSALLRTLTAGRRLLLVLDNAAGLQQVVPLLPGTAGAFVIVTSRQLLPALAARHGARRIQLEPMSIGESTSLLGTLIGTPTAGRLNPDPLPPVAVAELAHRCARLPLALRIAAEYLVTHPGCSVAELAERLTSQEQQLDLLAAGGDDRTALRAVFSWSYAGLGPGAARLFRLIGLHPGADLEAGAAAALGGLDPARARQQLDELARAHLVTPSGTGRYAMHDLLRAYAWERAGQDAPEEVVPALGLLLEHYCAAAAAAMDVLVPFERHRRPRVENRPATAPGPATRVEAQQWLDAERANLVAAATLGANGIPATPVEGPADDENGPPPDWARHTVTLSATLWRYLDSGGHSGDLVRLSRTGLQAAIRLGDRGAEGRARSLLGMTYGRTGRTEEALAELERAAGLLAGRQDRPGLALAVGAAGSICAQISRHDDAEQRITRALELFEEVGDDVGRATALSDLGGVHQRRGRYAECVRVTESALAIFQRLGDLPNVGRTLANLGTVYDRLGDPQWAAELFGRSLAAFRDGEHHFFEGRVLGHLAASRRRCGRPGEAIEIATEALTLVQQVSDHEGEALVLAELGSSKLAAGRPAEAEHDFTEALEVAVRIRDRSREAQALTGLGRALQTAGRHGEAAARIGAALAVAREVDDRFAEAEALRALGDVAEDHGDPQAAEQARAAGVELYRRLGLPEAELMARWTAR